MTNARLLVPFVLAVAAAARPSTANASPARRLARQGVIVVPVPTAVPAPPVVVPIPGAVSVVAPRPLRPWRTTLVQPVAVLVPVPVGPVLVGSTSVLPASPGHLLADPVPRAAPGAIAPGVVAPQQGVPTRATPVPHSSVPQQPSAPIPNAFEPIPAPLPAPGGVEPELRFGSP